MSKIPFRELPGFSGLFCDYAEGRVPADGTRFPVPDLDGLIRASSAIRGDRREALREFLQHAGEVAIRHSAACPLDEGSVVVWATVAADAAGGQLAALLKAVTAVALSRSLKRENVAAIAVICITPPDPAIQPRLVAPDADGQLLSITPAAGGTTGGFGRADVSVLPGLAEDKDLLELLCFSASVADKTRAFAKYLAERLADSGAIVVESLGLAPLRETIARAARAPDQGFRAGWELFARRLSDSGYAPDRVPDIGADVGLAMLLPVAAVATGPEDLVRAMCWAAGAQFAGLPPVLPWPRLSATLLDSRSRKMLARHGLTLQKLFAGPDSVMQSMGIADAQRETLAGLEAIEKSVRRRVLSLGSAAPGGLEKDIQDAASSLAYQTARLRERFAPLMAQRAQSLARQIGRLCNLTAPQGQLQESVLSLPWMFHRFSNTMPGRLLDRLDPCELQHRVLEME